MLIYILSHRSTLYWSVDMLLSSSSFHCVFFVATISSCHGGMDPHYISGGHIPSYYFSWIRSVLVGDRALIHLVFQA
jgi:hypothetical protein